MQLMQTVVEARELVRGAYRSREIRTAMIDHKVLAVVPRFAGFPKDYFEHLSFEAGRGIFTTSRGRNSPYVVRDDERKNTCGTERKTVFPLDRSG
jgi:hypothetical protein